MLGANGDHVSNRTLYRSLASVLQYLIFTPPHFSYVDVRGTMDYGLHSHSFCTTSLVAYSDADWVGWPVTLQSTSGYCLFLGNNLLSWFSKRQLTLSWSNYEAGCYWPGLSASCAFSLSSHIFTKGLLTTFLDEFRFNLSVHLFPAQTARE
ncbi:ribonuclease H-like domain-containing protein [Tanacetum coccineum]